MFQSCCVPWAIIIPSLLGPLRDSKVTRRSPGRPFSTGPEPYWPSTFELDNRRPHIPKSPVRARHLKTPFEELKRNWRSSPDCRRNWHAHARLCPGMPMATALFVRPTGRRKVGRGDRNTSPRTIIGQKRQKPHLLSNLVIGWRSASSAYRRFATFLSGRG